jgi:hypothetical protein
MLRYVTRRQNVGVEVLSGVAVNSNIFWGVTHCSPVEVHRRLAGTYSLNLLPPASC